MTCVLTSVPKGWDTQTVRLAHVTSQHPPGQPVLHCRVCDFAVEILLMLEKVHILFIAYYFLPFYYSVMCSEKLEKCVLDRVRMKFCSYQGMALKNKMTTNCELKKKKKKAWLLYNVQHALK